MNLEQIQTRIHYLMRHQPSDLAERAKWDNEMTILVDLEVQTLDNMQNLGNPIEDIPITKFKQCTICGKYLKEEEFSCQYTANRTRRNQCKGCIHQRALANIHKQKEEDPQAFKVKAHMNYEKNKEKILANQAKYRKLHPKPSTRKKPVQTEEEKKAKQKAYRLAHPFVPSPKHNERNKVWAKSEAGVAYFKAYYEEYREAHKEEIKVYQKSYRERMKQKMKLRQQQAQEKARCKEEAKLIKRHITVIPITREQAQDINFLKAKKLEGYESIDIREELNQVLLIKVKPHFYASVDQVIKQLEMEHKA